MREFVNKILNIIGASSLTDPEFDSLTVQDPPGWDVAVYKDILKVLDARDTQTIRQERLRNLFLAKGVPVGGSSYTPKSNIFIGGVL